MAQKKQLTFSGHLQTIPLRNQKLRLQSHPDGKGITVMSTVNYHGPAKWLKRWLPLRPERHYSIEGVACEVFESIDGKCTLEQLIDAFAETHKLTFFEARALLMQYLQTLMNRGLIAVAVPAAVADLR